MNNFAVAAIAMLFCAGIASAQNSTETKTAASQAKSAASEAKNAATQGNTAAAESKTADNQGKSAPAEAAVSGLKVEKMVAAAGVTDKEPAGENTAFAAGTTEVYCWMKVSGATEETVTHIWYSGGTKVASIPLKIAHNPMRTWSSKIIWAGNWKVEAVDSKGSVLSTVEFTVAK